MPFILETLLQTLGYNDLKEEVGRVPHLCHQGWESYQASGYLKHHFSVRGYKQKISSLLNLYIKKNKHLKREREREKQQLVYNYMLNELSYN